MLIATEDGGIFNLGETMTWDEQRVRAGGEHFRRRLEQIFGDRVEVSGCIESGDKVQMSISIHVPVGWTEADVWEKIRDVQREVYERMNQAYA